jgi:Tfp pilus assembly protein PilV
MTARLRDDIRSDEGMSIVEIVIAMFILFFVVTAVLGLTLTSTRMSVDAKQRTIMTNAVSSHLEWVRSLDFKTISIVGSDADAAVPAVVTRTVDGFTVALTSQISDGQAGTKEIRVSAIVSRPGYRTLETTQFLVLRDASKGLTQSVDDSKLTIDFGAQTPPQDAVVYGTVVRGGSTLYISAQAATSGEGVTISDVRYYCSGTLLRDGTSINSDVAAWQPMTVSFSPSPFRWNTQQVDDDGNLAIADGWRIVRIEATDSNGLKAYKDRKFYVDNYPPDAPADPPVPDVRSSTDVRLAWTAAMDGTHEAWEYVVWLRQINAAGSLIDLTDPEEPIKVPSPAYVHGTAAFSRYEAEIASLSPRGFESARKTTVVPYVSRPAVTGTSYTRYQGNGNNRYSYTIVNLSVNTPTFPTSQIRYDLFMGTNASNMTLYAPDCGPTYTNPNVPTTADRLQNLPYNELCKKTGSNGNPDPWLFQYRVTFTPSGYMGGAQQVVWSNVIGPITATANTTVPMPHVRW